MQVRVLPFSLINTLNIMSEDSEIKDPEHVCCDGWEENIHTINMLMSMATMHSGFPEYEGPPFKYCPYCGSSRIKETK